MFFSRALVPVGRDPLQVDVNGWPQDVGHPCPVVLFGLDQPLRIFDQDVGAEGGAICPSVQTKGNRAQKDPNFTHPLRGSQCEFQGR